MKGIRRRNQSHHKFRVTTVLYVIGAVSIICMGALNFSIMHFTRQSGSLSAKKRTTVHPMEYMVKMKNGPRGTWKLVDWANPISSEEEGKFSCNMTSFVAKSGKHSQICIHTFEEVITSDIKKHRRWKDCDGLLDMWKSNGVIDDNSVYVDIGGNIGTCVMEMLMSTNASIIAFEPHPMNVYNIKKTVSQLGKEYQDRLLLFPVGLGNEQRNTTIYSGHDNMGNSQLGTSVQDWGSQKFSKHLQLSAFIERMDSLLDADKIDNIKLVKMDCQGFECKAVEGFGTIAQKMKYMKFEYTPKFLRAQGCTDLVQKVRNLGFNVFLANPNSIELHKEVYEDSHWLQGELIALRKMLKTST